MVQGRRDKDLGRMCVGLRQAWLGSKSVCKGGAMKTRESAPVCGDVQDRAWQERKNYWHSQITAIKEVKPTFEKP